MFDLKSAYVRAVLMGVTTRVQRAAEALDWADGQQALNPSELAPALKTQEDRVAWERFIKQVQSMGPRAYAHKRTSAIGSVSWGGDDPNGIDEQLRRLNLDKLAAACLKTLVSFGIAGLLPHQPEQGAPRLQRMGGYVEPLYAEDDVAGDPVAWLQVLSEGSGNKYRLRVYTPNADDPTRGLLQEWRQASAPYEIGNAPSAEWPDVLMPTIEVADTAQDGTPIGELVQALPLLKGEVAQQIRVLRASDANAWPKRWAVGDWEFTGEAGALDVFVARETGSTIGVIEPPTLDGPRTQHDRILERLRGDLKLPISSISTGDFPSGEALEQANAISISTATMYAGLLTRLLSGGVQGYAELLGIPREKAPPVSVEINREQTRRMVTEQVRNDYREGLIPFRAAVITISQYYPAWSDDEVEAWIEEETARIAAPRFDPGDFPGLNRDDA